MKIIAAKCPSCGANLEIDSETKITKCSFCKQNIILDDEKILDKDLLVSLSGIKSDKNLLESANKLLEMGEFLKSKKLFLEFTDKHPDKYQGWLGLLISRTRNFAIKDNNTLFESDIEKYNRNFQNTATDEIKEEFNPIIENYLNPVFKIEEMLKFKNKIKKEPINFSLNETTKKIILYFCIFIFMVAGLSEISSGEISGLFFILFAVSLIPKFKEKIKKFKIKPWILSIIFLFIAIILTPPSFEGKYEDTENNIYAEFFSDTAYITIGELTFTENYTYDYENSTYTIEVIYLDTLYTFIYDSYEMIYIDEIEIEYTLDEVSE